MHKFYGENGNQIILWIYRNIFFKAYRFTAFQLYNDCLLPIDFFAVWESVQRPDC